MDPRHQAPWDLLDWLMAACVAWVLFTLVCGTYAEGLLIGGLLAWAGWV